MAKFSLFFNHTFYSSIGERFFFVQRGLAQNFSLKDEERKEEERIFLDLYVF